eukprot:1402041-Pyramimonas_sp.AAC.3
MRVICEIDGHYSASVPSESATPSSSYHTLAAQESGEQPTIPPLQHTAEVRQATRQINWCTVITVAYVALLVAVGLAQNDSMWRRMKRDVLKMIR